MALLSIIGFLISWYVFTIEHKLKKDKNYKPMCDLSDRISCSKPLLSPYGTLFGIGNSILGMIFYANMFMLALFEFNTLLFYGSIAACISSIIFAYLLYFKIKSFCLVCTAIYIINALMLLVSFLYR